VVWTGGRSVSASEYWQVGKNKNVKIRMLNTTEMFAFIGCQAFPRKIKIQ
jgi:hypothetical protein